MGVPRAHEDARDGSGASLLALLAETPRRVSGPIGSRNFDRLLGTQCPSYSTMLGVQDVFNTTDWTSVPITTLPDPDRSFLRSAPLDLVVCQVRFEQKPEIASPQVGLAFHDAIGGTCGEYGRLEPFTPQAVNVELGDTGASVTRNEGPSGWRFSSADGAWIVSLMPEHLALESKGDYPGWEEFFERLNGLLDVLIRSSAPAVERRTGLRYIDHIREIDAKSPADWAPYLAPQLLGFAVHDGLAEHLAHARQQLLFDLGDGHGCILNHGFVPEESDRLGYVLDYDVFREGGRAFDASAVRQTLLMLHEDALKLFHASTTDALRDAFR
jgi:uncharacterized protein (TIGR04255 family)